MLRFSEMLAGGPVTAERSARISERLLFDRGPVGSKYSRFFLMLLVSSVIAAGGIVTDSTAVVIGAMIIAPLMIPMLATAFSLMTGDVRNVFRSLLITTAGAVLVVVVAALVTRLAPTGVHLAGNSQVIARTAPRLIDLVIALAAGAAGAIAAAREDVAEVLPGVAVAISVVPPLCVAGAAFAEGSPQVAMGALLLFTVNFFAIQLAGSLVFASMGFAKSALSEVGTHARRVGIAAAIIGTVVSLVPLAATSTRLAQDAVLENRAAAAVSRWLEGTGYESLSLTVKEGVVTVQITGRGASPQTPALAALLAVGEPRPQRVRVFVLPQEIALPAGIGSLVGSNPTSEAVVPVRGSETTAPASFPSSDSSSAAPSSGTSTAPR